VPAASAGMTEIDDAKAMTARTVAKEKCIACDVCEIRNSEEDSRKMAGFYVLAAQ
jgi:hypothetical protein